MSEELVSIITPCYNASKYIEETIRSVMAQTYKNWEMIIVDDGSTDNSKQIIKGFEKLDDRLNYFYQDNAGSASARNYGLRLAKGRYVALLDADDLWDSNFLEEQIAFMGKNNAVCVCSSYRRIDENSIEILHPTITKSLITYNDMMVTNRVGCLSGLYDTAKYGKVYLHEELKSIRDDYAYWLDIAKLEGAIYGNPKVLASYRVMNSSTTGNKVNLIKKQFNFYRDYLNLGFLKSLKNTAVWGFEGILKYRK